MIKNNNKSGISTIIATVLIVLITVAAVTILWSAVSPLIDQGADIGCFKASDALTIDNDVRYTNFTVGELNLRIERGADSGELVGFDVLLDVGGNTVSNVSLEDLDTPRENGALRYNVSLLELSAGSTVKVAEKK